MKVNFSFLKSTKNFIVFRELDSKGVQFPDDWKLLSAHPEQHHIGSIYLRTSDWKAADGTTPTAISIEVTAS